MLWLAAQFGLQEATFFFVFTKQNDCLTRLTDSNANETFALDLAALGLNPSPSVLMESRQSVSPTVIHDSALEAGGTSPSVNTGLQSIDDTTRTGHHAKEHSDTGGSDVDDQANDADFLGQLPLPLRSYSSDDEFFDASEDIDRHSARR